jgi:membrane protease YdiL (CAAX protease family)
LTANRQLGAAPATCAWALISAAAGLYGAWLGPRGRPLFATLAAFAIFLLVMLLCAARGITEEILARFGGAAAILLATALFLTYLMYTLGTGTFSAPRIASVCALIFVPLAVAASAERRPPGVWQDFAIIAATWAAVKFLPVEWLWPFPSAKLSHVFTVLLMVDVGIAVLLLVRRIDGVGYSIAWGPKWGLAIGGSFLTFAVIALPLGLAERFVQFAPRWSSAASLPFTALGILLLTAWPEEFLFRGLLQNILSRTTGSDLLGWCTASVLFGLAHITNNHFPNWRYVLLATIAGFFYGWTWKKTGSIFASALLHGTVDTLWHFLFKTL